jgi:4'-phosphopantetheinyl transferase
MTPKMILHPEEGKYMQMTSLEQEWNSPPADFKLLEHEVHVWQISLQQPASTIHYLEKILVKDEVMGAERFVFDRDRNHFIVARGFLRILLGRYLGKKPNQLQFSFNAYGKPFLLHPSQKTILHFNLSHSITLLFMRLPM